MSGELKPPSDSFTEFRPFEWNPERSEAALQLAQGKSQQKSADAAGVSKQSIVNWLKHPDFAAEVDKLSLMVGPASKAERVRIAMRVIQQKVRDDGTLDTKADLLDWVKFVSTEISGLTILGLAAQLSDATEPKPTAQPSIPPSVAGSRPEGGDSESVN